MKKLIRIPVWLRNLEQETVLAFFIGALALAVPIAISVVIAYLMQFNNGIANDQEIWGQFGDFIGGTLNPIFGFLTLIALLLTLVVQSKELHHSKVELRRTADAALRQSEHRERESRRTDLYRLIEKLADRINRNYNENRLDGGNSVHGVVADKDLIHPRMSGSDFYIKYNEQGSKTQLTVVWIKSDLERLKNYIIDYELESKHVQKQTPISEFFRAEYGEMVALLNQYGMISPELFSYFSTVSNVSEQKVI